MKWTAVLATAAIAALAAYVLLWSSPLLTGSANSLDSVGLAPSGDYFVYRPNSDYYVMSAIRNGGSLPVSIKGPHQPTNPDASLPSVVGFQLARGVDPQDANVARADAAPFTETLLAPGNEVWVWIHFHTGPCPADGTLPLPPGSGTTIDEVPVDWTILGIPRVSAVSLGQSFDLRNPDSYTLCSA